MKSLILLSTTAFMFFIGCRSSNDTGELKDLNNYTRSESTALKVNQCQGFFSDKDQQKQMNNWLNVAIPMSKEPTKRFSNAYFKINTDKAAEMPVIQRSLRKALSAVPVNLQQAFFTTGGEIDVSNNANMICLGEYKKLKVHARTFVGEGRIPVSDKSIKSLVPSGDSSAQPSAGKKVEVSGCWVLVGGKKDPRTGEFLDWKPKIILNGKVAKVGGKTIAPEIEHSTVRLFGYLLSQILAHMDVSVKAENVFDVSEIKANTNDLFTSEVKKLVSAVRKDVAKSSDRDFFYYQKTLANLDAERAKIKADKNYKPGSEFEKLEMAMYHYTFAESFDSYYCNDATNLTMKKEFTTAYNVFYRKDSEDREVGLAAELDYILIADEPSSETGWMPAATTYQFADLSINSTAYQYAFQHIAFLRFFRGVGRFVGAVFRGVGRFVVGAVRTVAWATRNIIRAGVRVISYGAQLVARAAVGLARGALYIGGRVIGHAYSALAPYHSSYLSQYRGRGPFRRGFTDATRVWFPTYRTYN